MTLIPHEEKSREKIKIKVRPSHLVAFFVFLAIFFSVMAGGYGLYIAHWTGPLARWITGILPLPAATVAERVVYYEDVLAIQDVLGDEADWNDALRVMVHRATIENLAAELNVVVEQEAIDDFDPEGDVEQFLSSTNWTQQELNKYIVQPLLLEQELEAAIYASRDYQADALNRLRLVEENIELGVDFGDLALQHSEDISASLEGDLGYVTLDELDSGLEEIFELEYGEVSEILEAETYFAIAQVYDIVESGGEELRGVQLITINKDSLASVLDQYAESQTVKYWVQ